MKKNKTQAPAGYPPNLNMHKADDFKSMYSNWVQVSTTPFDISIVIGEASSLTGATLDVVQKAKITFHPAEARIVAAMLLQTIGVFEKQYGEIIQPKGIVAPIALSPNKPIESSKESKGKEN